MILYYSLLYYIISYYIILYYIIYIIHWHMCFHPYFSVCVQVYIYTVYICNAVVVLFNPFLIECAHTCVCRWAQIYNTHCMCTQPHHSSRNLHIYTYIYIYTYMCLCTHALTDIYGYTCISIRVSQFFFRAAGLSCQEVGVTIGFERTLLGLLNYLV